jgi:FtsP/CotA-like multicopper oxidase with cupredoxin domain
MKISIVYIFMAAAIGAIPLNVDGGISDTKAPAVITPNVGSLPWIMDGDVKVFHLIAEPLQREFAPGFWVNCWGYNGSSPGPTIEAVEGDLVRIYVTNKLPEPTSVHWHGLILPNGMDGVVGLTQKEILPGETFKYEFPLKQHGTFMYHSHGDDMFQIALGMEGFFIIHPKEPNGLTVDRDFALFLHEWLIPLGAKSPEPLEMVNFNIFTFNSIIYPLIEPLVVKQGQRVRIRLANAMMSTHPIHLHGHEFTVTRRGGKPIPSSAQYTEVTTLVAPGETRDIEFIADNPGDWAFHCHKSHHTMNQMNHEIPNLTGVDPNLIDARIRKHIPNFMGLMGTKGMGEMFHMYGHAKSHKHMQTPINIAPIGSPGPFGVIEMGGMFTILKVRKQLTSYADPGWYEHPPGTVAEKVVDK